MPLVQKVFNDTYKPGKHKPELLVPIDKNTVWLEEFTPRPTHVHHDPKESQRGPILTPQWAHEIQAYHYAEEVSDAISKGKTVAFKVNWYWYEPTVISITKDFYGGRIHQNRPVEVMKEWGQ